MSPVSLKSIRSDRDKARAMEPLVALREFVQEVEQTVERLDGWALVAYELTDDGGIITKTGYRVSQVMDLYRLPDMARVKIERAINESVDVKD